MPGGLEPATIRDFGGGWNVADSDMNLSSRFQPVSENIRRGIDGSFGPRWGMELYVNFADGVETEVASASYTVDSTDTQPYLKITKTAHGYSTGDHVTITSFSGGDFAGIPEEEILGTHSILVEDANTFRIAPRSAATSTLSESRTIEFTHDTHTLAGNIIHKFYFNRRMLVFTDIGEVGTFDEDKTLSRIWDHGTANALTGNPSPTRACTHWSCDAFKSSVIACNGYDNDKPIQIYADFSVEFLVDKATSSNASVPKADYVICMQGFVIFGRTEYGDPYIEASARGTDGTFTREASPADAVEKDLSLETSTSEPTILGLSRLRDKMFAAFYDRGMIGSLGIYDSSGNHQPDFDDTISEHGTVSHRTIVPLGNDIFMCDYAGVPSVSISQQSGIYVPTRLSELIGPAIRKHLASLSEETLRQGAFAVFNKSDRSYMLFVPKYDEIAQSLDTDPILFNEALRENDRALVIAPNHKLIERSYVTVAGATDIGTLAAADINGVREVVAIVDEDSFVIQLGDAPGSSDDLSGGGSSITITPVNDETICYAFEYNRELKIRRWTRYRGWNFACGAVSQRGKVFLSKGLKVYRMGNDEEPIYADFYGEHDYTWATSTAYAVDDRVKDSVNGLVYKILVAHTSPSSGTFEDWRTANPDDWEEYEGEEIWWELETPWSDMRHPDRIKINKYISMNSEGVDTFSISCFVNELRADKESFVLDPIRAMQSREMQMTAGDTGGYGITNTTTWGGGRRTREQKLWPFELRGKLLRWRFEGRTTKRVRIIALTMYYRLGNVR